MSVPPQYIVQGQQPQQVGQPAVLAQPQVVAPQPGSVMYYPQVPGGAVYVMPQYTQPKYDYTPNDFLILSVLTMVVCGVFSPLTLAFTIPATCFSLKSRQSSRGGAIKLAKTQGMVSAYLSVFAITFALILACICVGLVLGLYGPDYALQQCINKVRDDNGGVLPVPTSRSSYFVGYC